MTKITPTLKFALLTVENRVEKAENPGYQNFPPFPIMFTNPYSIRSL